MTISRPVKANITIAVLCTLAVLANSAGLIPLTSILFTLASGFLLVWFLRLITALPTDPEEDTTDLPMEG